MKKILIALTIIGTVHYSANAQTKHNFAQNYPVCRANDAYTICGEAPTATNTTPGGAAESTTVLQNEEAPQNTQWVQMNEVNSYEGYYQRHHIIVSYDDPRNPYNGLPSIQDDGPAKNDQRNLNYNQTNVVLPSVNGQMP
jgi:hypothetical protein